MKEIKPEEFTTEIKSGVVLVDCFATWCQPCKMLARSLENAEKELPTAKIVKLDVDQAMDIVSKYGVHSVPTLLLFGDGKLYAAMTGFKQVHEVVSFVNDTMKWFISKE